MAKTNSMRLLDKHKIPYQTVSYEYDSEDLDVSKIAADNGLDLQSIYKTLVCHNGSDLVVAVIPGHCQLNLKSLAKVSGHKKLNLLSPKDLKQKTGYIRGGCCPIALKKPCPVFVDTLAENCDQFLFNAGIRGVLIATNPKLVVAAFAMKFAAISRPA